MWKCPGCGEAVDDQFNVCWKCGETRPDSAERLGAGGSGPPEDPALEGCARGIGIFRSRSPWITLPLGLLLLFVAFVMADTLFEHMFRAVPPPR